MTRSAPRAPRTLSRELPPRSKASPLEALGVIRVPSLADQAYEQLTKAIVSLAIAPGERVIIEQLAASFGVSRTPLREALPRLIGDGLLEEFSQGLLRVTPITARYVREISQTRAGLEATAAYLAAPLIPDDVLAGLEGRFRSIEPESERGDFTGHFEVDAAFHETVSRHCGNRFLHRVLAGLHNHVYRIRNFSRARSGSHVLASHSEHLEIVRALVIRDGRRAKELMEAHVVAAGERVAGLIGADDA